MYTLNANEKTTPVMLYTQNSLIRGEVVTTTNVLRVNIWLRTDGVPKYLHILKPQVLVFGGSPVKAMTCSELYYPCSQLVAFHTLPPIDEPLDYESTELNRTMKPVDLLVGTFLMKGKIRISTHSDMSSSLESARISWMSIYEVEITNSYLPQMPPLHISMVLVNPMHVTYMFS